MVSKGFEVLGKLLSLRFAFLFVFNRWSEARAAAIKCKLQLLCFVRSILQIKAKTE